MAAFVTHLADLANLAAGDSGSGYTGEGELGPGISAAVIVAIGPVAEDAQTGEPVVFPINAPDGSPHMAIMGGTNSGKTYTALTMLKRLRGYGPIPMLAFDFKGEDLSEKQAPDIGATIVSPPRIPVPLQVLSVQIWSY